MASREAEIRDVVARLDALLDDLHDNVGQLTAILTRPGQPSKPEEARA